MIKYLVGAHGTGKSTLLKACRELYPDTYYSEGVTRPIVRALRTLQINEFEVEQELINELTVSAYRNQIENTNILCTRSIIDLIVYNKVLHPEKEVDKYIELWRETGKKVDLLIYTPIEFELKEDEIRKGVFGNRDIQIKIDEEINRFFQKYVDQSKIITVRGSTTQRLDQIKKYFK